MNSVNISVRLKPDLWKVYAFRAENMKQRQHRFSFNEEVHCEYYLG